MASYETVVKLFERIQFFLQRLHHYTPVTLTPEMTELLAHIMAQILSILALSTKTMKDWRISWFIQSIYAPVTNLKARKNNEEANGKDGGGGCTSKIRYADTRGESDDGGENLRGSTPCERRCVHLAQQFLHTHADHLILYVKIGIDDLRRSSLPDIIIDRCG